MLISSLVNLKAVGLYSNYTMIINQLSSLITPILNGIGASVGNLIATEDKDKAFQIFNVTYLINFWMYSFSIIFLYNLLEPFIDFWLGKGLLLGRVTFIVILLNFYLTGLRKSISIFKEKAGIFTPDKYAPIIEAAINLIISIILAKRLGLIGIFLGTTISSVSIPIWLQAKIVYNKVFNKSVLVYFKKYLIYLIMTLSAGFITTIVCNKVVMNNEFFTLVFKGIICIIIPNTLYLIVVFKTNEFKYIKFIIIDMIKNKFNNRSSKGELNEAEIKKNSNLG